MLDISFIRQNTDIVEMMAARRGVEVPLKKLLACDDKRKAFSKEEQGSESYAALLSEWRALMLSIPNIPDISSPQETTEIERVGSPVATSADVLSRVRYAREHMTVYTAVGTKLAESLASFREAFFTNCSHMCAGADMGGFIPRIISARPHAERDTSDITHALLLERPDKPSLYLALGAECEHGEKKKEAIHRSAVARGLVLCEGTHAASVSSFEAMRTHVEEFCTRLNLPYMLESIGVPDMPKEACKMYRVSLLSKEASLPLAEWYYAHDYVTRRYGILSADAQGKKRYMHSVHLNVFPLQNWVDAVVQAHATSQGDSHQLRVPTDLRARFDSDIVQL